MQLQKQRMSEKVQRLPRARKAATEFNVSSDTLSEFFISKGFDEDDLKGDFKLSADMYEQAQAEFQQDMAAKAKAEKVELIKSDRSEPRKRRDERDLSFSKKADEKPTESPEEEAAETPATAKEAEVEAIEETPPVAPEVVEKKEEVAQEPVPEEKAAAEADVDEAKSEVKEEQAPVKEVTAEEKPNKDTLTKISAPALEGPKVINKIDLSKIDSSTKPKKGIKAKPAATTPPAPVAKATPKVEEAKAATQPPAPTPEIAPRIIENITTAKLAGPKIMGKIELPKDSNTRPKRDDKGKRKRIPKKNAGPADNRAAAPASGRSTSPRGRTSGGGYGSKREDKVIDEKEIQEKLKQTQAKLAGAGGRGRSLKAKYRKQKREDAAEAQGDEMLDNKLQVTEFISVSELAGLMEVSFADIISKCMTLGIMVSINQRLEADVIELVASEFDFEVEFIGVEDASELDEEEEEDDPADLVPRAPIVTIMGHVDHGKTSLLDYIRNTNVIGGEAGGITQHIGAYEVKTKDGRAITFLDTPGHEAFTAMRARGAKVTDIAVIVIAADDAVMPQTKEAISHAQAANVPMIFAINKIDREGSNPEKIKEQLAGMNILVESWGGKYQSQEISAKAGTNIDELLEKILLETDILELKANPERQGSGTVIEATLDKGRGYVATILVQNGTLKHGDMIVSGQFFGKAKAMYNERNVRVDEAPPSTPVLILGLNGAPQAGETFKVYENEADARSVAYKRGQILREQGMRAKKHITLEEIGRRLALGNFKELNIIIKGDVDGSVEALSDSLQKMSTEEIVVKVIHKAVGAITESDVTLANASDAIIIGFNVRPTIQSARLAEAESIEIKLYSVIYKAIEEIKSAMEGLLEPGLEEKILGNIEIKETYRFDKATVAGCMVLDGKLARNNRIRLVRDGIVIHTGELASLKRFRDDAKEVTTNMECGLVIKNYNDIKVGDIVEAFEEVEVKRTL